MKKLLTFACAITITAIASAASLDWSAYGALNDGQADEDWYSGGQAYLVLVTDTANFSAVGSSSGIQITGGQVVMSSDIDGGTATGSIDGSQVGGGLESGSDYNFAVLFTTNGEAGTTLPSTGTFGVNDNNGGYFTITWNSDTGATIAEDENSIAFVNTPAGGSEPVPEPTSVALLALGLAALGLKRKVA